MLVNLYDHHLAGRPLELAGQGITIKRGLAADKDTICGYVAKKNWYGCHLGKLMRGLFIEVSDQLFYRGA